MSDLYSAIETALQRAEAEMHTAETHGVLCGFLCTSTNAADSRWLKQVLPETETGDVLAQQTEHVLLKLQNYYLDQLNSSDFQFALLLPSDEHALPERLQALAEWCDGFSLGISAGGLSQKRSSHLSHESQEFLQDVLRFTELETQLLGNEENETAYMELTEYLKIGVVTLYEDCHPTQSTSNPPSVQ